MKRILVTFGVLIFAILAGVYLFINLTSRENILLIPLDSRPVNTQYAEMLGELGNAAVNLPPAELLDSYLKPAQTEELMAWLETNSAGAGQIIIFANELFNGGLIASRDVASYQETEKQLYRFEEYLEKNNKKNITVLFVLPRHLPSQFTELWDYKDSLTHWAEISDKLERDTFSREEKAAWQVELSLLQKEIPPDILNKYTEVYTAAGLLVQRLVKLSGEGRIDELVIGLDDAAPYGLSIQLYNKLKKEANTGPDNKIKLMHGADDLAMLVLAKKIYRSEKNLVFDVIWLSPPDKTKVFSYEGIPAGQMIEEKIEYIGGKTGENSKFKIFIHSRSGDIQNRARQLTEKINSYKIKGNITGLADIAYTNRADTELLAALGINKVYELVDVFAGWNTAGNSIGTVLAHSVLLDTYNHRFAGNKKDPGVYREFQAVRIIEDYLYQGMIRKKFNKWAQQEGIDLTDFGPKWDEANRKLQDLMDPTLTELSYAGYSVVFPWPRSFEIKVISPRK